MPLSEQHRRRRGRNFALAGFLAALVILLFFITLAKLGRRLVMAGLGARKSATAGILLTVVIAMIGLSYAAVPLYRLFCQVTGYGGTPQVAEAGPGCRLGARHDGPLQRRCRAGSGLVVPPGATRGQGPRR